MLWKPDEMFLLETLLLENEQIIFSNFVLNFILTFRLPKWRYLFEVLGKECNRYYNQQQQIFQAGSAGQDWLNTSGYARESMKQIVFHMQFTNEKIKRIGSVYGWLVVYLS